MINTTMMTNSTNLYQMFTSVNDASNGGFISILLFVIFLIFVVNSRNIGSEDILKRSVSGSFVLMIISVLLFILEFIGWQFSLFSILLFFASFIAYKFGG